MNHQTPPSLIKEVNWNFDLLTLKYKLLEQLINSRNELLVQYVKLIHTEVFQNSLKDVTKRIEQVQKEISDIEKNLLKQS